MEVYIFCSLVEKGKSKNNKALKQNIILSKWININSDFQNCKSYLPFWQQNEWKKMFISKQ